MDNHNETKPKPRERKGKKKEVIFENRKPTGTVITTIPRANGRCARTLKQGIKHDGKTNEDGICPEQ